MTRQFLGLLRVRMNRTAYLADQDVDGFVNWLVRVGPVLCVDLDIQHSPKVPGGLRVHVTGLEQVTAHYQWKATWTIRTITRQSQNWMSTRASLSALGRRLRAAVRSGNCLATQKICLAVLSWGGNRRLDRGAWPFLDGLGSGLPGYLAACAKNLALATTSIAPVPARIRKMNSMLTKVHALTATDGLPIYDSRVAIAIATLVESYRLNSNPVPAGVPSLLAFPSRDRARDVVVCFSNTLSHGTLVGANATADWVGAKIRLGWILAEVLRRSPGLFAVLGGGALAGRMHAFEVALFMIGYDAGCLARGPCAGAGLGLRLRPTRPRNRADER